MKKIKMTLVAGFLALTVAACTGSHVDCEWPREHYESWQAYEDCAGAAPARTTNSQSFSRSVSK